MDSDEGSRPPPEPEEAETCAVAAVVERVPASTSVAAVVSRTDARDLKAHRLPEPRHASGRHVMSWR